MPEKVIQNQEKVIQKNADKGGMSMAAGRTQPDAIKVFTAIAMIVSRREDAAKVTLARVRKKHEEEKRSA